MIDSPFIYLLIISDIVCWCRLTPVVSLWQVSSFLNLDMHHILLNDVCVLHLLCRILPTTKLGVMGQQQDCSPVTNNMGDQHASPAPWPWGLKVCV